MSPAMTTNVSSALAQRLLSSCLCYWSMNVVYGYSLYLSSAAAAAASVLYIVLWLSLVFVLFVCFFVFFVAFKFTEIGNFIHKTCCSCRFLFVSDFFFFCHHHPVRFSILLLLHGVSQVRLMRGFTSWIAENPGIRWEAWEAISDIAIAATVYNSNILCFLLRVFEFRLNLLMFRSFVFIQIRSGAPCIVSNI